MAPTPEKECKIFAIEFLILMERDDTLFYVSRYFLLFQYLHVSININILIFIMEYEV